MQMVMVEIVQGMWMVMMEMVQKMRMVMMERSTPRAKGRWWRGA